MTDSERLEWLTAIVGRIDGADFGLAFAVSAGFGRVQGPSLHRIANTLGEPLEVVCARLERLQGVGAVKVLARWPRSGWPRSFGPGVLGQADDMDRAVMQAMASRRIVRAIQAELRLRRRRTR